VVDSESSRTITTLLSVGRPDVQVVWFKRDLRVHDHGALAAAVATGSPVLPLYVFEPSLIAHPHTAPRHIQLIREGLIDLREALASLGAPLIVRVGEVVDVLDKLNVDNSIGCIHAHEEFGVLATWQRDKDVAQWARQRGVRYVEHRQSGAMRGLTSRDHWSTQRTALFSEPLHPMPTAIRGTLIDPGPIPELADLGLAPEQMVDRQPGGEVSGRQVMRTWLTERSPGYERNLSSPVTGWKGCSRLSVHLALGTVSAREVSARAQARKGEPGAPRKSLSAFEERLAWRDHFTQKLEDAPFIEERALHPAFDDLRPKEPNGNAVHALTEGLTGYPMVDAVARSLAATGWTTFRMRSMLASFASYDLWLPWQTTGGILARWFADYDPGIHWPQIQMQSGVTGMNALRMYDPVKQQLDHDPTGVFVRRWVPELRDVPLDLLATPWLVTEQQRHGYPDPIVDHPAAVAQARRRIAALRQRIRGDGTTRALLERHGSRRPPPARRRR
jgi:deoxyribodipyrimidine photo-lyase